MLPDDTLLLAKARAAIAKAFVDYLEWQNDGDWQSFLDFVADEVRDASPR
jgi:hypothetical protein